MSKVIKSTSKPRRRRPNKKLVTTLDALADALPQQEEGQNSSHAVEKERDPSSIITRKSMKSRPGAMKRREKIDREELERFAKNMAQMSAPRTDGDGSAGQIHTPSTASEKLAAMRNFIAQTLEQKPGLRSVQ